MIGTLLLAAAAAAAPPTASADAGALIRDAEHAIAAGRLDQAKLMAGRAIAAGSKGPKIERLLADLDFANNNLAQALTRYQALVASGTRTLQICGQGALAAAKLGRTAEAQPLADCAVETGPRSWRAWNTRAVVADMMRDWPTADDCYAKALALAPKESSVLNNQGWSLLLRGQWSAAIPPLERAVSVKHPSARTTNNLELARSALAAELPARRDAESDEDWAVRLNDAGVAAHLLGDDARAIAAFTQAVEASPAWYARAWNNLQAVSKN